MKEIFDINCSGVLVGPSSDSASNGLAFHSMSSSSSSGSNRPFCLVASSTIVFCLVASSPGVPHLNESGHPNMTDLACRSRMVYDEQDDACGCRVIQ